ncbi:cyclic AMP-dependent transcription factor ATF-2 isoform X2 [Pseudomyrmex gracilis]|uniref:cyclic AMP-dependent transcription factor ATF-2 isoform X2 n=1 Tax=Pseudomyrmex gracilis TaxID=219809 RepID=UPI0009953B76|nr:cyclic AMP-dependent transcription factor ATF-2 isoform X2 [Pseudomyrmex gracilis]
MKVELHCFYKKKKKYKTIHYNILRTMTDSEKLFVCSTSSCNVSFANEDQLILHKKKHDMMLNLGNNSKSAGFVDQTPTPTRFFKNCEEVGLFQDLQNVVNPFEETFRRAVEEGNTGTLNVPEAGITDDTLHTPHIFPYIADVLPGNSQILSEDNVDDCSPAVSLNEKNTEEENALKSDECNSIKLSANETQELMKNTDLATTKSTLAPNIIVSDTNTSIVSELSPTPLSHLSINGEEVQLLLKTADGKLMQLSATPISEEPTNVLNVTTKQQTVVIKTEPSLRCAEKLDPKKSVITRLSLAKLKLKQTLSKNTDIQNRKPTEESVKTNTAAAPKENNIKKTIDHVKKKDLQERNRASSMRARAKRKAWIQELERTVTTVNETNAALQMEVKALRAEVAKLKTLLLAHKDCPVTKEMQKGNGIVLGPKIISVNSPEVVTISASSPVKRSISSAGSSNKKSRKKPTLSITKNPVILPKVDCATNLTIPTTAIIKGLPALAKIVDVNQFLPEKPEETKQILIVQNQSAKLCETAHRQIIQINPNYEIEQTTPPKSIGT